MAGDDDPLPSTTYLLDFNAVSPCRFPFMFKVARAFPMCQGNRMVFSPFPVVHVLREKKMGISIFRMEAYGNGFFFAPTAFRLVFTANLNASLISSRKGSHDGDTFTSRETRSSLAVRLCFPPESNPNPNALTLTLTLTLIIRVARTWHSYLFPHFFTHRIRKKIIVLFSEPGKRMTNTNGSRFSVVSPRTSS